MKIFISHSGEKSTAIAKALRDWLPRVIQVIKPWMSAEDIGKGASWAPAIALELESAQLGVICITSENLDAPWILFETGALFNNLEIDYVCPYLFDIDQSALKEPLTWFQATKADKEDTRRLVHTINKALGDKSLTNDIVDSAFNKWWPDLEKELKSIRSSIHSKTKAKRSDREILDELLELARGEARRRSRSRGKYVPRGVTKLISIAESMLKNNERIEAKIAGDYSSEGFSGNYVIVKGLFAATNHRVLVVLNSVSLDIRKDSFTYGQVITVTRYGNQINLILPDETITLFDVKDDCNDLEMFYKYISDKKTPPPKTTIASRDVEIAPPPKK